MTERQGAAEEEGEDQVDAGGYELKVVAVGICPATILAPSVANSI